MDVTVVPDDDLPAELEWCVLCHAGRAVLFVKRSATALARAEGRATLGLVARRAG